MEQAGILYKRPCCISFLPLDVGYNVYVRCLIQKWSLLTYLIPVMYQFAMVLSLARGHMRKGALWFVK